MQTKLERYAAKYGEAFMNELPDIIRAYCLANDLRVPTKKRPSNLHIIRVIAEATSEVLGIPIENIYSKSRLRPLVIARSIIADIAYSEFLFTYKNIAIELNRDHATIFHNLATHVQDSRSTPQLKFLRSQVLHTTRRNLQTSNHPYISD
jgi:chromosomal replication initiation ATPase DnaA